MVFEVALAKLYLLDIARNGMSRIEIIDQMLKDYGGEIDQKLIRYQDIEKLKKMNLGGSSKVGLMMNDLVIKSNVDRI
jgi:hypothetical protein